MFDLLEEQLVRSSDTAFHYTHYRDVPSLLPTSRLPLIEPSLKREYLDKHQLFTTDLLSFFGIYMHKPTGLLICACKNRKSFALRLDRYELQDVINRSERNALLLSSKQKEGLHYINYTNRPGFKFSKPHVVVWSDLQEEITLECSKRGLKVVYEISMPDFNNIFPLLPVYLGIREKGIDRALDLSQNEYIRYLADGEHKIILFQRLYSVQEHLTFQLDGLLPNVSNAITDYLATKHQGDVAIFIIEWYRLQLKQSTNYKDVEPKETSADLADFYGIFPEVLGDTLPEAKESDLNPDNEIGITDVQVHSTDDRVSK
ncbi:hypothetical protein KL906_001446 [Ogataea polymorpha]|nr:hypothetical protein KL908_002354 [Ogataea polymorpha]KAG7911066.1 hypothetical protein KL906_001446 [Ogataea polymorpha]KAG7918388.1 hypothetical protein KL927_001845 [Ogataea polymorpha]KAG7931578.1 hypothetical protein KL934_003990 [Ogataea polymorpha]